MQKRCTEHAGPNYVHNFFMACLHCHGCHIYKLPGWHVTRSFLQWPNPRRMPHAACLNTGVLKE
jgi:hypothetical protein